MVELVLAVIIAILILWFIYTQYYTPAKSSMASAKKQDVPVVKPSLTSWEDQIQNIGLDPSVKASHQSFVHDAARTTTTASNDPIREDDENTVNFVGLRRVDYSVPVGSDARTVPSEYATQLMKSTRYVL